MNSRIIHSGRLDIYVSGIIECSGDLLDLLVSVQDKVQTDIKRHMDYYCNSNNIDVLMNICDEGDAIFVSAEKGTKRIVNGTKTEYIVEECEEINVYNDNQKSIATSSDDDSVIYGESYVGNQKRLTLPPILVKLKNELYVWGNVTVLIFSNGFCFFKLEIPFKDIYVDSLYGINGEDLFDVAINIWKYDIGEKRIYESIESLFTEYECYFGKQCGKKTKVKMFNEMFCNTILSNFEGIPHDINKINYETQKMIYKIIAAPINVEMEHNFDKEIADNSKRAWKLANIRYEFKTTGGCISYADKKLINYLGEKNDDLSEDEKREYVDLCVIESLCRNVEYALIITQIKRLVELVYLYIQGVNVKKAEYTYFENKIFLSNLQENCYGSVSEQIEKVENAMPFYLKRNIYFERKEAIHQLNIKKNESYISLLQEVMNKGIFILTCVFGLPMINNTLLILKESTIMKSVDLDYISVDSLSVIVWLCIICILVLDYKIKLSKNK